MKNQIKKAAIFIFGLSLLYPLQTIYMLKNDRYKSLVRPKAIYHAIEKSKTRNRKVKYLIIGDSVAQQLFDSYTNNDSICSLTTNQAITLAGQYFLINDFLSRNPEVEKVILIYTPFAFEKDLYQGFTYQYFLKPFYKDEYKGMLSEAATKQIQQIPFYYACQFPPVLTSNWCPDFWVDSKIQGKSFMSEVNKEYLTRIISLCNKYSKQFIILPTPTRNSLKPIVEKYKENIGYEKYDFRNYFSRVEFVADSCFINDDDVHLKNPSRFKSEYLKIIGAN